jgi:hypothetical protein
MTAPRLEAAEFTLGGDLQDTCRDAWHVFDWLTSTDTVTCHCGARTLGMALAREDAHVRIP